MNVRYQCMTQLGVTKRMAGAKERFEKEEEVEVIK